MTTLFAFEHMEHLCHLPSNVDTAPFNPRLVTSWPRVAIRELSAVGLMLDQIRKALTPIAKITLP
jgi:hypothetical protein